MIRKLIIVTMLAIPSLCYADGALDYNPNEFLGTYEGRNCEDFRCAPQDPSFVRESGFPEVEFRNAHLQAKQTESMNKSQRELEARAAFQRRIDEKISSTLLELYETFGVERVNLNNQKILEEILAE